MLSGRFANRKFESISCRLSRFRYDQGVPSRSPIVATCFFLSTAAFGQPASASIRATVRTMAGPPAAGATVLVHFLERNVDQTIGAGSDGTVGIGNLIPGHYQLTASKQGFASSSASAVEVAPGQALDLTLTLGPEASPGGFL